MTIRHFLSLSDAGGDGVAAMLADALDRKAARASWPRGKADADAPLAGHVLGMIFEKASTRTPLRRATQKWPSSWKNTTIVSTKRNGMMVQIRVWPHPPSAAAAFIDLSHGHGPGCVRTHTLPIFKMPQQAR